MKQLAGGDDIWFAIETDSTPMHILQVGIYDPSTSESGTVDLHDVKAFVRERLVGLPLRQKLLEVPWNADFPYWIEDEDFDLDWHIRQVRVPAPGDWPALIAVLAVIMEEPLDRARPLWEMVLLTGLGALEGVPEGCFALAQKVHHGQFDGTNIVRLSSRLHSTEPTAEPPPRDDWSPERTPSGVELLMRAPWNRTQRLWKGAQVLGKNAPKLIEMLVPGDTGDSSGKQSRPVPKTRFDHAIGTRERVFDGLVLPLKDVMPLRHRVDGATVNDVALSICAGALRKYLRAHGELPKDPLVISPPVSAHEEDEEDSTGNRISMMFVTLPTDVADPLERLRLVREATKRSKNTTAEVGAGNVADVIDIIPTYLLGPAIEQIVRFGLTEYLPQPASGVSITNVPGPRKPSYFHGARLVRGIGCPFLFDGVGLIIAISSYCDDFLFQFGSTPKMMPDPEFFVACLREAYDELAASS
jgi:WS/DGAT/MGAT family acyltransferase